MANFNIVLLDDNFVIREILRNLFSSFDKIDFFSSDNGVEGLGYIFLTEPNVLIIDSTLPQYSGREVIHYILTNNKLKTKNTKVIILTESKYRKNEIEKSIESVSNFLVIPKDDKSVIDKILKAVNEETKNVLGVSLISRIKTYIYKDLFKKANTNDILQADRSKGKKMSAAFTTIKWLLLELFISIELTSLRLISKRVDDDNIIQKNKDLKTYRVKYYPTIVTVTVAILFTLFQVFLFIVGGIVIFNTRIESIFAVGNESIVITLNNSTKTDFNYQNENIIFTDSGVELSKTTREILLPDYPGEEPIEGENTNSNDSEATTISEPDIEQTLETIDIYNTLSESYIETKNPIKYSKLVSISENSSILDISGNEVDSNSTDINLSIIRIGYQLSPDNTNWYFIESSELNVIEVAVDNLNIEQKTSNIETLNSGLVNYQNLFGGGELYLRAYLISNNESYTPQLKTIHITLEQEIITTTDTENETETTVITTQNISNEMVELFDASSSPTSPIFIKDLFALNAPSDLMGPMDLAVTQTGQIYVLDSIMSKVKIYDPMGTYIREFGSPGSGDGQFDYPSGIYLHTDNIIYIADTYNNRIVKYDLDGNYLGKFGVSGTGDGQLNYPKDVVIDSAGNILVIEYYNHRVQKFDPEGNFISKFGSQGQGDGQFYYPSGIEVDSADNIYVVDSSNHRVQKFSSTGTFITKWGTRGSGDLNFYLPQKIFADESDYLYVTDYINHRVKKFNSSGVFQSKFGGYGSTDGKFSSPSGIYVDSGGNIFVTESGNDRVQKFNSSYIFQYKFGTDYESPGYIRTPYGITDDEDGNIYISDYSWAIHKFGPDYSFIKKWGSRGTGNGQFEGPYNLFIDLEGNLAVLDGDNNRIQIFDKEGNYISQWGTYGTGDGLLNYPAGFIQDKEGNYYIADTYNHRIQKFDSDGNFILKWGSEGQADGQFNYPDEIIIDDEGYLYVADMYNSRIQKFDREGNFILKWGTYGTEEGQLRYPEGLALDNDGTILVGDTSNLRIQKFTKTGEFIESYLSGEAGFGDYDINGPYNIYVDKAHKLYVTDPWLNRVRIYQFDRVSPKITLESSPYSSPSTNKRPSINGSVSDELTAITSVQYQVDRTDGTWTNCIAADGTFDELTESFTCIPNNDLSDGSHIIHIKSIDSKENESSGEEIKGVNVYIDTQAPEPTLDYIGNIKFEPPNGTWYYTGNQPKLTGRAEGGSSIYIKIGTKIYTVYADAAGRWEYTPDTVQTNEYAVEIWSQDVLGNNSTKLEFALVIDPTANLFPDWLKEKLGIPIEEDNKDKAISENEKQNPINVLPSTEDEKLEKPKETATTSDSKLNLTAKVTIVTVALTASSMGGIYILINTGFLSSNIKYIALIPLIGKKRQKSKRKKRKK